MENNYILFKRERDFGEVFNATFFFLKQDFRKFGLAVVYYILPFALLTACSMALFQSKMVSFQAAAHNPREPFAGLGNILTNYGILLLMLSFSHAAILSTVYGYIRLYVEKGRNGFSVGDVWTEFKKLYIPFYLAMLLGGIMIIIGSFLCLFPGIYLAVSLSLLFAGMAFDKKGFGNAFSRTFELTHMQWWWTLLILFVLYLLLMIFQIIVSLPTMAITMTAAFHTVSGEPGSTRSYYTFILIYSAITTTITLVLALIPQVALAFHYYSLVEKKEKPTLIEKINEIGKDNSI
jgi:hypothetical protein